MARAALREPIVEAALFVLAERGLDATSYELIALRAGVSKGAVQHHFPAKGALALALLERAAAELRALAKRACADGRGDGTGVGLDWRAALTSLGAAVRGCDAGRALGSLRVGARHDPALAEALARFEGEALDAIAGRIADEARVRGLRVGPDARALAALVAAALERGDARAVEGLGALLPFAFSV